MSEVDIETHKALSPITAIMYPALIYSSHLARTLAVLYSFQVDL